MRILVDIGHPGHVHFYKNFIWKMQERGHEIKVTSRKKDVASDLLDYYDIDHQIISTLRGGLPHMLQELSQRWWRLLKVMNEFQPALVTDVGGAFITLPSKIFGASSVVFTDSEPVPADRYLTYPFADRILTPTCFMKELGKRHIRYNGFHEISYLHPNYFKPSSDVLDLIGIDKGNPYFILRFVSWEATHDIAQSGFSMEWKSKIIRELEKRGRVFISSEKPVPSIFSDYVIQIPPHQMHNALYYADLFLGDGATMATESGLLGTPAIRSSSLVGTMGNFVELMNKYKLVFSFKSPEMALKKALEILETSNYKSIWNRRRNKLFEDKIDVTAFMVKYVENYPNNLDAFLEDPNKRGVGKMEGD
jgi:predicted glycosyltransferase